MTKPRLYLVRRLILTVVYAESEEDAVSVAEADGEEYSGHAHSRSSSAKPIVTAKDLPDPSLLDSVPFLSWGDEVEWDAWYDDPPTVRALLARDGAR
jgi:hypothetical protein